MNKFYGIPHNVEEVQLDWQGKPIKLSRKDLKEIWDTLAKVSKVEPFFFEENTLYRTLELEDWLKTKKGKEFTEAVNTVYRERLD